MEVGAGVAGIASVGRSGKQGGHSMRPDFSQPHAWVMLYVLAAGLTIAGLYFSFGGLKGDVAS